MAVLTPKGREKQAQKMDGNTLSTHNPARRLPIAMLLSLRDQVIKHLHPSLHAMPKH